MVPGQQSRTPKINTTPRGCLDQMPVALAIVIIGSIFVIVAGAFVTWPAILGWISLAIGVITMIVGIGLWRGNPTARTVATIVFVISIVLEVIGMFNGESLWSALTGSALSIIGLILLYTRAARQYFGS